ERYDVNEGIRVSAILRRFAELRSQVGEDSRRSLLDAVLEPEVQYPSPLLRVIAHGARPAGGNGGPSVGAAQVLEDGSATWTVPLQISVNVGGFKIPARAAPEPAPLPKAPLDEQGAGEKIEIDRQYGNRQGYNPRFLKGFTVPMPKLSKGQRDTAAKLKNPKNGDDPLELKYTHFSIKMNVERRMAYFTACHIDGSTWINIDRDTGLPREAAEAAETWVDDPRIDSEAQCEQSLYDAQKPKRIFDRGHLVRRQDPTWGPEKRAIRANADTFHFSNCAPQASTFNQTAKFWQGIEQYILEDNAVADDDRIIVFTGPVFGQSDREYRYVKVPAQFFKVIARVQDGELLATALLADQSQFIKKLPESLTAEAMEAWDDTTKVDEFLSSVKEIEALTGLNFGVLRDHDTHSGSEAVRAPLTDFTEVPLHRPPRPVRPRPKPVLEFAPSPEPIRRVGASRKRR
nr:DNA/RNA non-specific endonuclease [Verrucomicrobiota bacterium]